MLRALYRHDYRYVHRYDVAGVRRYAVSIQVGLRALMVGRIRLYESGRRENVRYGQLSELPYPSPYGAV